jgi:hypothetical protein
MSIFNPTNTSGAVTQTQLSDGLAKKVRKSQLSTSGAANSVVQLDNNGGLTATGSSTLNSNVSGQYAAVLNAYPAYLNFSQGL